MWFKLSFQAIAGEPCPTKWTMKFGEAISNQELSLFKQSKSTLKYINKLRGQNNLGLMPSTHDGRLPSYPKCAQLCCLTAISSIQVGNLFLILQMSRTCWLATDRLDNITLMSLRNPAFQIRIQGQDFICINFIVWFTLTCKTTWAPLHSMSEHSYLNLIKERHFCDKPPVHTSSFSKTECIYRLPARITLLSYPQIKSYNNNGLKG